MKHFTVDLEMPMFTYPINLTAKQAKYIAREQL